MSSEINVNDLSDSVPLTKIKGKKTIDNTIDKVDLNDKVIKTPIIMTTKVKKPRKKGERTEKQISQFKHVQERRKEAVGKIQLQKKIEASKLLLEHGIIKNSDKEEPIKKDKIVKEISDSESSQEIIVVKKSSKKKKPKQKIVYISSSDSDSSSDEEVVKVVKPKREFIHQQNKKSVMKIKEERYSPVMNPINYFCD